MIGFVSLFLFAFIIGFESIFTWLENLSRYHSADAVASLPHNVIGVQNILGLAGVDVSSLALIVLAALWPLPYLMLGRSESDWLLATMAGLLVFPRLHTYDLTFVLGMLILLPGLSPVKQLVVLAVVALALRPGNVSKLTSFHHEETIFHGSLLMSLAALCLLMVMLLPEKWGSWARLQRKRSG